APRASAEPATEGSNVKEVVVKVRGDAPADESFVRSFVSTREGDPLSRTALSADVRALAESHRFSFAEAGTEKVPGGVRVVFEVEARRVLAADPEFTGLDAVSRSRALKTAELKAGDFVDEAVAAAAAAKLRALYASRRRFDAKVVPSIVPAQGMKGGAFLTFAVDEGERVHLDFLSFPGASAIPETSLGRHARLHSWYNPQSWVINPQIAPEDFDAVRSDARKQYLDAGYLDAEVSAPRFVREGKTVRPTYDVAEGRQYRVASVSVEGTGLFQASAVRSAVALAPGDVAGVSAMDAAGKAVQDWYASRGYPDTVVTYSAVPRSDGGVDVRLKVREGTLVHVRDVKVQGNTTTKEKVLLREIALNPGDAYDTVAAERSRRRLSNLGYFSDVRQFDAPAGPGLRDVFFDVTEKPTGSFTFGAGFSSVDHLIGFFSLSQSNFDIFGWPSFRGAGQKARLDVSASGDTTDVDVSFVEPWFLDRRLNLDVDLWLHTREYSEYDERRLGGSVGLAKFFPWVGRLGLDYGIETVRLKDVTDERFHLLARPDEEFSFLDEDDSYLLGWVRLAWTLDTRDNPLVPTRGTRANAHLKLHNAAFGSDYDFYEANLRVYHYLPMPFGTTLSLSGQATTADGMGGDEVPIGSRYFLGGGRNARGFRHRDLGPKAISDDYEGDFSPVGGLTKLWATAEWSVPVFDHVRLAAFYDVGNVWEDSWDFDLGDLATSAGVGIRFDFPGFPIRLDYAKAIDEPDEWVRSRRFVFWIGFDN
ncbi:MAG: outer membrane protein assembly factor BamA, partial [Kiritimatiellae bacterium]|nr:outer membrane protein assembly factor BamA [Kiritimatiellia bacterium]